MTPTLPGPGDVLTYTMTLNNTGTALSSAWVTYTLPAEVSYLGDLWASSGSYGEAGGVITWTGSVSTGIPISITFGVTISEQIATPYIILNTALIDDGQGAMWQREAMAIANGYATYLPHVKKP